MVSMLGNAVQVLALVVALVAAACLIGGVTIGGGGASHGRAAADGGMATGGRAATGRVPGERAINLGYLLVFANALLLTVCIGIVLACFLTQNYTLAYVVSNYPATTSPLKPLYLVSAVWAGRQGSLLLWTWLIGLYAAAVAWRRMRSTDDLSSAALGVTEVVIALFTAALVFSQSNNPFMPTASQYLNADGTLVVAVGGMNPLLMHWAMILHPPATFLGYAAMTIPFAYAMAALIVGDFSPRWVELCNRTTVFGFIFLTIGMALGAVWAYVVLGWGGFWAWDAVENASLMSWLTCVALIHSFTMYRKHGCFKRWSMFAATITFIFVVLGTFITRSGLVQSVHAFAEDAMSTYFFLAIMVLAGLAFLLGMLYRHGQIGEDDDQIESLVSKNGSYYITNLVMIVAGMLVAYLTLSSALPGFLPLGGQVVAGGVYWAVARPVGVLVCLLMAVCPMLGWRRTDGHAFARNMRVPAVAGAVVFALLMVLFATRFVPEYGEIVAAGGDAAVALTEQGPSWYYFGLTIAAFLAASLLLASSFYLLGRGVRARMKHKGEHLLAALVNLFRRSPAQAGGYLTHLGVAIVVIGLVGSTMYVREATVSLPDEAGQTVRVGDYQLELVQRYTERDGADGSQTSESMVVELDVTNAVTGESLGRIAPSMEVMASTGQSTLHAEVLTFPLEDLFVAFQGLNADGSLSLSVKVNPLILLNWIGAGVSIVGITLAFLPRRATPHLLTEAAR